jgi:hypothetical protein
MESILKLDNLKNKPMIALSLLQQREGNIDSIVSALRVYNQSFYVQQIITTLSEDVGNFNKTDMYAGIIDSLLGHPYFEFIHMYVNNEVEWFLEMIRIMRDIISDDNKMILKPCEIYSCNSNEDFVESEIEVTVSDDIEKFLDNTKDSIMPIEIDSFCYAKETFDLLDLGDVYQSMGYFLSRKLYEIKDNNRLVGYAISEVYPNEIDSDEKLNALKLYILDNDFNVNKNIETILSVVSYHYKKFGIDNFVVISGKNIKNKKLTKIESSHSMIMSREGVVEFLYFIKANII